MEAGGSRKPQARPAAPLPLDRAIPWAPQDLFGSPPDDPRRTARRNPLFIARDVIDGVNRHTEDEDRRPRFGFLFGHLFHCPASDSDYAVADTLIEAPLVLDEHAVGACLFRAWEEIQANQGVHTALLMGWYHSHYLLGVRLSEGDIDVNRRYFDAPWQFSIVVAPRADRTLGGVFRGRSGRGATGPGRRKGPSSFFRRLRRPAADEPSSFFELLPWAATDGAGPAASALHWSNYRTSSEIAELARQQHARLDSATSAPEYEVRRRSPPPPRRVDADPSPSNPGISASKRGSGSKPDDASTGSGDGRTDGPEMPPPAETPGDQPAGRSAGSPAGPPGGPPGSRRPKASGSARPPARPASIKGGESLSTAGGRDSQELPRVPLPLDRAVLWSPRGASGSKLHELPLDRAAYLFFIEREALADINRHLAGGDRESRFGFLLGRLFHCPLSGRRYVVADMALPAREVLDEGASGAYLMRAWTDAQSRLGDDPGLLLGWYHSHYLLGLTLSQSDFDVNRRYFGAPWQCSIVIVPDLNRALGGVFRPAGDAVTPEGSRPTPFYELLPEVPADPLAPVSSAVVWTNYEADRKVQITAKQAGASVAAQPKGPPALFGASEGRPGVPLVIPAEGSQTGLLPPRSRRIAWPILALIVVAAAVGVMLLLPDSPRPASRGSSTGAATDPSAAPAGPPATPPDTPEYEQFLADVEALGIAGDRYTERANDFDADRIPCQLLATGYVAADEAYVRVAASYRALDAGLNSRASSAYERAGEEIAEVNTHFDASGCPRP